MVRVVAGAAVVVALALVAVSGAAGGRSAPAAVDSNAQSKTVVVVPLGKFPRADAGRVARHVASKVGLRTQVAGSIAIPRSMRNGARKQYVAERLITLLSRPTGAPIVVIGLTVEDMYPAASRLRFTFSLRDPNGFAVVSRARMDPRVLGLAPDPGLRMRRLLKMVMKNVGALALGHRTSGNPRSVMFDGVGSVDDIDFMTEEFRPAPSGAKQRWLGGSTRLCKAATSREVALTRRSTLGTPEGFVAFLRENIALRVAHRSELAAVAAAPEDRAALRALNTRFGRAIAADRAALDKLEAAWSQSELTRWAQGRVRTSVAMKASALELGSRACGRYFDPQING